MKRLRGYHLLFGITLAAMGALSVWWTVFFLRSVELERTAELADLRHVSVVTALMLGREERPPVPGTFIEGKVRLEIILSSDRSEGDLFSAFVPGFPDIGVRPDPALIRAIDARTARRRFMFVGEGLFLFVLLGVCTSMLYRLVRTERRQLLRMEVFLSTVTHEMKTPLTGLKSMLQTFAAGRVPAEMHSRLYAMGLKEAERLEHMVENVLIAGQLRTDVFRVDPEPLALRPLLEGFVAHRRQVLVDRPEAIALAWELSDADVEVRCDRNALHTVLDNLTDNAFKYGGSAPQVTLRVRPTSGGVEVIVEDRGIGFDPSAAERLFAPFHREQEPNQSVQHGTGLGLSIARALVERMGSALQAASPGPGQGSRFSLTLRSGGET